MWSPLKCIVVEYRALIMRIYFDHDKSRFVCEKLEPHIMLSELRGFLLSSAEGETVTSLSVEASKKALEMANVDPQDIDLLLLCTSTLEDLFGSAPQVQKELGCSNALAFDLTTACSGFVLGLVTASCFIKAPIFKSCDSHCQHLENCTFKLFVKTGLSLYMDHDDVVNYGSGCRWRAVGDHQDSLLGFNLQSDGGGQKWVHGIEIKFPARASYACLQMNGKEVFRFAVRAVPQVIEAALQEAGLRGTDSDWLLLHQANQRIIDSVSQRLEIPTSKVISNLCNYGNTSAASIPLALDEAVRSGFVQPGHILATAGSGMGLTWGSAIVRWS
ncbi:unnamed protein product [Sphagnum troendelagicum]|uniref:Beta-ketoacyl-[acyl-carrier-protein] synthase III C-terminal domain-containing protein n=1 Tax=Sphagnum troendelagicum TaxID=128251 RepID=A0ABP0TJI4_9BRYO